MNIQPPVTRIGLAIIMVVGLFIEGWAMILLFRGEHGPGVATFAISGLSIFVLGVGQLGGLRLTRAVKGDKPLDKPAASRHLAGPGGGSRRF